MRILTVSSRLHRLYLSIVEDSLFYPRVLPPKNMTLISQGTKKHHHLDHTLWNSSKISTLRRPGNTRHQETPTFQPRPLELTLFIKNLGKKHPEAIVFGQRQNIHPWTTFFHHFKTIPQQTQARPSSRLPLQNSTLYRTISPPHTFRYTLQNCFTTPSWQRLVNNDKLLHPAQAKYIS